jgi:hypothetical protein
MNKQIQEFEKQCWSHYVNGVLIDGHLHFDAQKFAELIVKECLAQVDKVDAMLDDNKEKTGVAWVGLAIARHFGVEE